MSELQATNAASPDLLREVSLLQLLDEIGQAHATLQSESLGDEPLPHGRRLGGRHAEGVGPLRARREGRSWRVRERLSRLGSGARDGGRAEDPAPALQRRPAEGAPAARRACARAAAAPQRRARAQRRAARRTARAGDGVPVRRDDGRARRRAREAERSRGVGHRRGRLPRARRGPCQRADPPRRQGPQHHPRAGWPHRADGLRRRSLDAHDRSAGHRGRHPALHGARDAERRCRRLRRPTCTASACCCSIWSPAATRTKAAASTRSATRTPRGAPTRCSGCGRICRSAS